MRIRHQLSKPTSESPFEHDKLNREVHGKSLTKICDLYEDGFVLALNGTWGTGKTSFIEMWVASLQKNRKTAYFNAWSDDYSDDPLPALLATFKDLNKEEPDAKADIWKEVLKLSSSLVKNGLPALLGLVAKKYIGVDKIDDLAEALTKGSIEYLTTEVKEFNERKESFEKLQRLLKEYVASNTLKKKAVVVIDELDRCRPHYAVAVLELVKHLFSVEGVVFVLAIDKEQLKHSICGVYGSEQFDASSYLQRFIDIEYRLPDPDEKFLVNYFLEYFDLTPTNSEDSMHSVSVYEKEQLSLLMLALFKEKKLTIRKLEKLIVRTRLALNTIRPREYKRPELLLYLAFLAQEFSGILKELSNTKISPNEILQLLEPSLPSPGILTEEEKYTIAEIEVAILFFYNNKFSGKNKISFDSYKAGANHFSTLTGISSRYDSTNNNLDMHLASVTHGNHRTHNLKLDYYISKVEQFQGLDLGEE